MTARSRIAAAAWRARKGLSPAQRALRGERRRYHIWMDASAILARSGHFDESLAATDRAIAGWTVVDPLTARELEKD